MHDKVERILLSREVVEKRIKELAVQIEEDYAGETISIICLLRGGFMFTTDLVKEISKVPLEIDFMATSSYGNESVSSGNVDILTDVRVDIEGKNILIIDDIIDSGRTLNVVKKHISEKQPKSLKIAVMLDKTERRVEKLNADYVAFNIPDVFIVGYGLDYNNYCRNKPYIYTYEDI